MPVDPGSFRDPDSRVFLTDEGVFRALSERGREDWRALRSSSVFGELTGSGALVATDELEVAVPDVVPGEWAAVLRHERVPFVSYPYEWTFGMLRDAALLQLETLRRCLDEGLMLKDSSPYNVQWRGAAPVFVDVGSFERLRDGEPWVGYRQFCMLFLYPLMLQAYKGVPFHAWLRGSIDGITPAEFRGLISFRDRFRKGVTPHVVLHSRLERRYARVEGRTVERDVRRAGFSAELIKANVRRLRKLVDRLDWDPGTSAWTGYREDNSYADEDAARKAAFVGAVASARRRGMVWDLGANDGIYSRIAAPHAGAVLAMDADHPTVERLYRRLRSEGTGGAGNILPLVVDVCDPSPDQGWRLTERRRLEVRGAPDLTLALALVHHIAITGNVPLAEVVRWLASLGGELVVEFPTREDPMVRRLLAGKREGLHADYEPELFERLLGDALEVRRREALPSGTRILFHAVPRGA